MGVPFMVMATWSVPAEVGVWLAVWVASATPVPVLSIARIAGASVDQVTSPPGRWTPPEPP